MIHRDTLLVPLVSKMGLVCHCCIDIVQKINAIYIHMKLVATARLFTRHVLGRDFNAKTLYLPARSGHVKCRK